MAGGTLQLFEEKLAHICGAGAETDGCISFLGSIKVQAVCISIPEEKIECLLKNTGPKYIV